MYTVVAYKEDGSEYYRNSPQERHGSDFEIESYDDIDDVVRGVFYYLKCNKEKSEDWHETWEVRIVTSEGNVELTGWNKLEDFAFSQDGYTFSEQGKKNIRYIFTKAHSLLKAHEDEKKAVKKREAAERRQKREDAKVRKKAREQDKVDTLKKTLGVL